MSAAGGLPPIPKALSHLPVVGGMAVPYVTVVTPDGRHLLGHVDASKHERALAEKLCQVCGWKLQSITAFLMCDNDFTVYEPGDSGWMTLTMFDFLEDPKQAKRLMNKPVLKGTSGEAGLHPHCARYTMAACAMVAGGMSHYRSNPPKLDQPVRRIESDRPAYDGRPARPFFEVRVRSYVYDPGDEQAKRRSRAVLGPQFLSVTPVAELLKAGAV